jgi:penicillin-binding protein 1A
MGKGMTGGVLAAPIFTEFMKVALKDAPPKEFQVPQGIELIPIDRRTGRRARAGDRNAILEAFKPDTGPPTSSNPVIGALQSSQSTRIAAVNPDASLFTGSIQRLATGEAYQELPNGVIIKVQ